MISFLIKNSLWILGAIIIISIIICRMREMQIKKLYPNLKSEIKNCHYCFLNVFLTDHYIVKGTYYKVVIPYEDIKSYEEIDVDMYFRAAGRAIAITTKDGKTIQLGNVQKNFQKEEFSHFKSKLAKIC